MIKTDNLLIKTRNVFRKTSAFAPPGTQTGMSFHYDWNSFHSGWISQPSNANVNGLDARRV